MGLTLVEVHSVAPQQGFEARASLDANLGGFIPPR
jgi:hypothetical protein